MPQIQVDWKLVLAVGGVFVVLYYLAKREAAGALTAVGEAINPVSPQNILYQGASAVTSAVTGQNVPLGSQIYDWLNPAYNPNAPTQGQVLQGTATRID